MIQSIIDHHYINRLCDCSCHQKENLNRHLFIKERSHLNVTFVTKLLSQFMMEISPWYVWLVRKYLQQRNLEFARKEKHITVIHAGKKPFSFAPKVSICIWKRRNYPQLCLACARNGRIQTCKKPCSCQYCKKFVLFCNNIYYLVILSFLTSV